MSEGPSIMRKRKGNMSVLGERGPFIENKAFYPLDISTGYLLHPKGSILKEKKVLNTMGEHLCLEV